MNDTERRRLRVIAGIILLFSAVMIGRLYYLQVGKYDDFNKEGEKQYVASVPNLYERGSIFFKEKDGTLRSGASLASGYLLAMTPDDIIDAGSSYSALAELIDIDKERFLAKAAKKGDIYEEITGRIDEDAARSIRALEIPGIRLYRETWRYYPGADLASRVIGFVGFKGDVRTGRYGVESYYNDTLERKSEDLYVNFFAELFTDLGKAIFDRSVESEGDLVLTIEPSVQQYLEDELAAVMAEWHSEETGGIIMDPSTGAIYAMGVDPSFDLNEYNKVADPHLFGNPTVESAFEMGSIVKPITMAAGLDAGVVTAATVYNDAGSMTLNGKTFGNFDGRARGPGTSMQQVLNESLNTGAAFVAGRIGNARFAEYLTDRFRLGEETGIDLPGEIQGLMTNMRSKRDIEYATASFGQGIAMTPINITVALAALGNGGLIVTPHVVDEIRYESGRVKKILPNPPSRAISATTSEEITRMLVGVVDTALLGGTVKVPEYSIAAKTGTAQIARSRADGGGYYDDRYLHTFFGYFPAYDPKFIVFLYTYDPKEATFASHTLTHPFMRISKFLLNYYHIPPDRSPGTISKRLP